MLAGGFLAAIMIRALFFATLEENWDSRWYAKVVAQLERGEELFHGPTFYSYSPLWALVLRGLSFLARHVGMSLFRVVGLFLHLTDLCTAALVFAMARTLAKKPPELAAGAALLFFLNPVSILATGRHNQFENVAILFLLVAIFYAERRPLRTAPVVAGMSVSLLVKHIAWFHPLLFIRSRRRAGLSPLAGVLPYIVFALSFLPYWNTRHQMVRNVLGYRSMSETYGTAVLLEHFLAPGWVGTALFVLAGFGGVLAFRGLEIGRGSLLLFLVLLLFLPGIAQYYLIWPIALGAIYGGAGFFVFTAVVSAFFLGSPDGLAVPFEHFPGWHGIWWATLFWLMWELRRIRVSSPKLQVSGSESP